MAKKNKKKTIQRLGGGLKYVLFSPQTLGKIPILTSIFFRWLEIQPPTSGKLPIITSPFGEEPKQLQAVGSTTNQKMMFTFSNPKSSPGNPEGTEVLRKLLTREAFWPRFASETSQCLGDMRKWNGLMVDSAGLWWVLVELYWCFQK